MRKSKELIGMPVVSLEEGMRVGRVAGLVLNPPTKAVAALVIEKGGLIREQRFVPFTQVYSIGANAVTLQQGQYAAKGASLPEILRLFRERVPLIGARVVAENGTVLGYVTEYLIDTSSGAITAIEIAAVKPAFLQGTHLLESTFIRTIGKEIVVVNDAAGPNLTTVDGGLKEHARRAWEEVKSKGQRWNQALGAKIKSLRSGRSTNQQDTPTAETQTGPTGPQSNNLDTDRSS